MKSMQWILVAAMSAVVTAAVAQAPVERTTTARVKDAVGFDDQISSRFKVLAVDAAKHQLTLEANGLSFKVRVRSAVPLAQIKVGSEIDVVLAVREVTALLKPGGLRKSEETVVVAPDGALEGVRLDNVYEVWAVDSAHARLRLQNAHMQFGWLKLRDPALLTDAKVGDQVRVVLSVSEVVDVRTPR